MLASLFKSNPVVDEDSQAWIFDTFAWCIDQLDGEFFKTESTLILPDNSFYPGRADSVQKMAEIIFANTVKYAGMSSWPIRLVSVEQHRQQPMPKLLFNNRLRGEQCSLVQSDDQTYIDIAFHPSQLNQPQDLIAYLVQQLAGIMVAQRGMTAPGGQETFAQTVDLVACFMGFGVIFVNTAYQFKGGCGSCNNRSLNRQAALPELETVYALALFCFVKGIDIKPVKKALKSHLNKPFKQACKEIHQYLQNTPNPVHALLADYS